MKSGLLIDKLSKREESYMNLKEKDPVLYSCVQDEADRQAFSLEMIASESIQPREALLLAGSVFNNKTAVGQIGNQRLLGSHNADRIERIAAERACEIFGADYANMVTYSGSVANFCAYSAVLSPHDRVVAMEPSTGSHQSHGGSKNISSKLYDFDYFGLDPQTFDIDYAFAEKKAKDFKPKLIVIGSAAFPRIIDYERLAHIAHKNGALLMADIAHFTGLVSAGYSPNPVPFADIVTASTTKTMCGPHSGFIMCKQKYAKTVENAIYPGYVASLHLQTIAAMAYVLERSKTPEFKMLMKTIVDNAGYMCAALKKRGFEIFTGGTDCHMFLLEMNNFGINGVEFANILEEIGISSNSKGIPFDPSPVAMGIRMGTTVLSQRGMGENEMETIADIIYKAAINHNNKEALNSLKKDVIQLATEFPIPSEYRV